MSVLGMPKIRNAIRFILNGEDVAVSGVAPDETLLDWLRLERAAARHQGRLRRGRLRRLHGAGRPAARRQAGL